MAAVKAESGAWNQSDGSGTTTMTLPSGLAVGDPLWLVMVSALTGLALTSIPSGWASDGSANIGTGSWLLLRRTGGWQTADGTSLFVTYTANQGISYAAVGLDGTLYAPDTYTLGTVTARGSSITTTTAASVGTTAQDKLVVSMEKAATHTGTPPTAPSVSPATTLGSWHADVTASTPSAYVGIYSGTSASRTITYTTASSNGAALQIALTAPVIPDVIMAPMRGR